MNTIQGDALTREQVLALVACMLSTAHVDGLRPEETALIQRFYDESAGAGFPAFADVEGSGADAPALLGGLRGDTGFVEQLVLMCLMAGYADGHLTDAERSHVVEIAKQVGVSDARFAELLLQVKDSLIGSLAHLPVPESVAALARTL